MLLHARTIAISEAEELTQYKSKTADRALRLHRLVLALRRARAQLCGARARNRPVFPEDSARALTGPSPDLVLRIFCVVPLCLVCCYLAIVRGNHRVSKW